MAKEDETPRTNSAEIENLIEQIRRTNLEPGTKEKIEFWFYERPCQEKNLLLTCLQPSVYRLA